MKKFFITLMCIVMVVCFMPTVAMAATGSGTKDDPFTSLSSYNTAVGGNKMSGQDVYVTITDGVFNETNKFVIEFAENWSKPPKLHLTLKGCTFKGNTSGDTSGNTSFMYLSNCQELVIDGCTFDAGDSGLKYGINWNLINITGAEVSITNSTFKGKYEKNAVKLNQRGGEDDLGLSGIEHKPASIKSAYIAGCTFEGENAILALGSQGKGGNGAESPSTGAFPITITGNKTNVIVREDYTLEKDATDVTVSVVPAGKEVTKETNTQIKGQPSVTDAVGVKDAESLQAAINAATAGQTVVLLGDTTGNITIPVGADVIIEGNGKTLKGSISFTQTKEGGTAKATINNLILDGQDSSGYGIFGQNTRENGLVENELTLNNCTIENFAKKGIYLTNAKKLDINGCTFKDNAKGQMDAPNTYGDYAVDLNLYDVQDAVISITGCTFEGISGSKAAIKVTQRGGADDEGAADGITENQAKIKQLTIKNCVFNNNEKPGNTYLGDIVLGSSPKSNKEPKASCGAFPVTITAKGETTVCQRYLNNDPKVKIPDGQTFSKGANTDPITRVSPTYIPSTPTDPLKTARTEAIKAVSDYVNPAGYEEAQQAEIKTIVDNAKKDIEAAKTADEIKAIEAAAKAELDKLETAEEMALIRTIEGTQFTARSKATTLNGKKAIRVTWNKPADLEFDGYEIYRSTERYKGYGTEPFFTTTNQKYTNNKGLKVGKTYYYRVRGFKYVNDEKVYTEYSLKAWRTVK